MAVSAASEELCSVSASGKQLPGALPRLPGPCSCPAVQTGMQHWSLGTMSTFASLIPAALYAFALLSDLERRNTDSWRMWNELQSTTARAGWPVKPTVSTAHSPLTAAWWRLVSLLPGWFGDLQNSPHSGAEHPQAVSCAVFPHFNYL